jgi:hypothetical protein
MARPLITKASLPAPTRPSLALTCALAWVFPGAGHMLQGQAGKALLFGATLLPMYLLGLWFGGRLFPFEGSEPLVLLAGLAQWLMGAVRIVSGVIGAGQGDVVAVAYEYGNTFLIVSGLLNALVILDASDIARGRKSA